jgi:hypothetical protein
MTPRWSGPDAPEVEGVADPRTVTLEAVARLLEPLALDVATILDAPVGDPEHGALDALPDEQRARLLRLSGQAAALLDDARKALATRDTLPRGGGGPWVNRRSDRSCSQAPWCGPCSRGRRRSRGGS